MIIYYIARQSYRLLSSLKRNNLEEKIVHYYSQNKINVKDSSEWLFKNEKIKSKNIFFPSKPQLLSPSMQEY